MFYVFLRKFYILDDVNAFVGIFVFIGFNIYILKKFSLVGFFKFIRVFGFFSVKEKMVSNV